MAERFQACSLVGSPFYPNAIAWSEENLIAVASGHLVTLLNPTLPYGPRGLITTPNIKPFPVGVIEKKDLLSRGMLPTCLFRDRERPCIRALSWSPLGLSSNGGCLLAVCTADGRVKLYRQPFSEFRAEWVEVMDISDMLCDYLAKVSFGEVDIPSSEFSDGLATEIRTEHSCADDLTIPVVMKGYKRRRGSKDPGEDQSFELAIFPCSNLKEGSNVEVHKLVGSQSVWISGILDCLNGAKARVLLPETDENGKPDEWVEINPENDKVSDNCDSHFPKVRPSMNVGCFPKQILSPNCSGVGKILSVGQAVEAWKNDRWVEGQLMGFGESGLLVKFHGDIGNVTLDACSVRLAPLWMSKQNSWQVKIVKIEMQDHDLPKVVEIRSKKRKEKKPHDVSIPKSKSKALVMLPEKSSPPLISADQYASRTAMLSSLAVAWSPVWQSTSENGPLALSNSSSCCSLLAVGGKSGKISFWRICEPQCYSVEHSRIPITVMLAGLLGAHSGWVTAISWVLLAVDGTDPQILLVTGSSDGSAKIWLGNSEELMKSPEVNYTPFSLLKEVIAVDSTPVSVLSVTVPVQSSHKMLLAVGKGSGSFEVWSCDMSTRKFDKFGSYDAHHLVVTGLAWAFDGRCLYSCSQDNSVRSWIVRGSSLFEVPIPSNTLGVNSSSDIPNASDSCFGVAVSSGNLVLAVARSFDVELLNQMYQARTQKAAVEFFWIGGQQLDTSSNIYPEIDVDAFSKTELFNWESNIMWSLKQYEQLNKPLVIWDIVTALSTFKQSAPKFVEGILVKWLSISYMGSQLSPSAEEILSHASRNFKKIASRLLHLLNIMSRRVVLSQLKADKINTKQQNLGGLYDAEQDQLSLWMELLFSSEKELRERLVGSSFSKVLGFRSCSTTNFSGPGYWHPVGLAQMEQWIALNYDHNQDQLKLLASEVGKLYNGRHSTCEYVAAEQCNYCSASVPFESPEVAYCQKSDGAGQSHKLARCAVSMQVCPATPVWFCTCCHRRASKLAPHTLFQMQEYPTDFKSSPEFHTQKVLPKPFCPFCGILQQRLQPTGTQDPDRSFIWRWGN